MVVVAELQTLRAARLAPLVELRRGLLPRIDPGALLARTWRLDSGLRVRLRDARPRDAAAVGDLPSRCGVEVSDLRVQRYRGEPVLTWWEGRGAGGGGNGEYVILDAAY